MSHQLHKRELFEASVEPFNEQLCIDLRAGLNFVAGQMLSLL